VAAQLEQDLGIEAELVVGNAGEFTVWADDRKIAEKVMGKFPEADAVVSAVKSISA
jgi:hypothetical protein